MLKALTFQGCINVVQFGGVLEKMSYVFDKTTLMFFEFLH